jgi:hypothetical protein
MVCGSNLSGSVEGALVDSCQHGIEPSGCVKYWEIL